MNNKDKLLIIGASGHGRVIANIALCMNTYSHIAFLDDSESKKSLANYDTIGNTSNIKDFIDEFDMIVGIGDNETRAKFQMKLKYLNVTIPILVHPSAIIGERVKIGEGSVVMANAVINCDTTIGAGCIINTAATIDHDNIIGDFVHVSPGSHTAGTVSIGSKSWLGIGSIVRNNITICENCNVGAGAVVVKNISCEGTYIGIPSTKIKK
ncbi:MAG: acetyltransferase [Oscillospiraceae bacterium]